jgi:hypothetical protein
MKAISKIIKTRNLFDSNQQESIGINRDQKESTGIKDYQQQVLYKNNILENS